MPVFEYQCESCDTEFELLVRAAEKPACPDCGSGKLEKLMSASAGRVGSLPVVGGSCPPSNAPPCRPNCCRIQ